MNKIKPILLGIIAICIVVLVWYVTIKPLFLKQTPEFKKFKHMYSNNNVISLNTDTYSILSKKGENKDNKTNLEFEFSGTDTIWEIEVMQETKIKLDINTKITNGKFKLVLVTPSSEVTTLAGKKDKKLKEVTLKPGKTKIKIVGLSAKGTLNLKINTVNSKDIIKTTPHNNGVKEAKN